MIKDFKFFRGDDTLDLVDMVLQEVQSMIRSPEHINVPIPYEEYEGWSAHMDNLSPGQCPYDIRTIEREHWMTGWSNREDSINR